MAASTSRSCSRVITLPRLTIAFLFFVFVLLMRDSWLPEEIHGQSYRSWKQGLAHTNTTGQYQALTNSPTLSAVPSSTPTLSASASNNFCASMPRTDNIMVLLKTGATELYQKLPTHFLTTFLCIPNDHFRVYSDLEQSLGGVHIHNAIAPVGSDWRDRHPDFELYRKIEKYKREGQDMGTLSGGGGWHLDKWKFLPMFHDAFTQAPPEIDWFIAIEADTSMSWVNMLAYLDRLDPSEPIYAGSQNVIGETLFAHGGSGLVISRKAADLLEKKRNETVISSYDAHWEDYTSKSCCGDEVVARAFLDAGVPLTPAWPMIQGETVASLDWTAAQWCAPALTWHHVTPLEVDQYWQFEHEYIQRYGWDTPYLYRDVFDYFIEQHISVTRTRWSNLSQDRRLASISLAESGDEDFDSLKDFEKQAVESQEDCSQACVRLGQRECVQWQFSPGRCHLGSKIRFGKADERDAESGEQWVSGWVVDRVKAFQRQMEGCEVKWTSP